MNRIASRDAGRLFAAVLNSLLNAYIGISDSQTSRAGGNILSFVLVAFFFSFFMRWLAGINDEHAKFRIIYTIKALTNQQMAGQGKYLEMLFERRGCIYAGPLPVTMKFFGTLASILGAVGPLLLIQTGISEAETTYTCKQVEFVENAACNVTSYIYGVVL